MEEIKEVFKEKKYDELTLNLINNFLYEFEEVFGKFVTREDLIQRIKNNLDHSIEFVKEDDKRRSGLYNKDNKKIFLLEGMDEEMLKSVFFHEMIHCITAREKFVGFGIAYHDENNFGSDNVVTAVGLTEGFTQLATKKRNQRFGIKMDTYPILTEQVENIVELIGEDKFFDIAFNNPLGLEDAMLDAGIVQYYGETEPFLQQFDTIWRNEKKIYSTRDYGKSGEEKLLNAIRRFSQPRDLSVETAKNHIIVTLLEIYEKKPISTVEELIEIYNKTTKYANQLDVEYISNLYSTFFMKFNELEFSGMNREDILDALPDNARLTLENQIKFDEFMELSPEELLKAVVERTEEIDPGFLNNNFADDYVYNLVGKMFPGISERELAIPFFNVLKNGFAQKILSENYNINMLAFEFIDIHSFRDIAFNMYLNDGETANYLGTFSNINSDCELEEYAPCSEEERIRLLREKGLSQNNAVLKSPTECLIIYSADDMYTLIDDDGFSYDSIDDKVYCRSCIEVLQGRLQKEGMNYKKMLMLRAPKYMLSDNLRKIQETKSAIEEKRGRKKFTPYDIEVASLDGDVSLVEIESILEEFKTVEIETKEIFKKGIGIDE